MNRSSRTRSGCCRRDSLIQTQSSPLPAVQFPHQPFRQHCGNDRFANEESGVKDIGREQQEDISVPINTFLGQNVSKLIPHSDRHVLRRRKTSKPTHCASTLSGENSSDGVKNFIAACRGSFVSARVLPSGSLSSFFASPSALFALLLFALRASFLSASAFSIFCCSLLAFFNAFFRSAASAPPSFPTPFIPFNMGP